MALRCKPGDLAIVTYAPSGSEIVAGSIVKCMFYDNYKHLLMPQMMEVNGSWTVEFRGSMYSPTGLEWGIPDERLQPIRDQDGEDETLQWAPVPKEIEHA